MSRNQEKPSTWVIRALWKNKTLDYSKVPLLDTVFYDSLSTTYLWFNLIRLFTDKFGLIKKKGQKNASKSLIESKFLSAAQDRDIISHKISLNTFTPITRSSFDLSLIDQISNEVALQCFRPLLGHESTRIYSEFKLDDGRPLVKHTKKYQSDGQEITIPLAAQNLTEALKTTGEEVISAIEKNSSCKILTITLVFIQDSDRKIWLMGSASCSVCEKLFRSATPSRLEKIILDPCRTTSNLRSKKLGVSKEKCPGDFCEYILDRRENFREDYEDYLTKITLNYIGLNQNKYKQELASNCIEREYEKIRLNKLSNKIPFRYILIGKKLLETKERGNNLCIDDEEVKEIPEPEYRAGDKVPNSLAHPSRIYDETKVCERCYTVYNLFRIIKLKANPSNLPKISRDIPSYYNIDCQISDEKRVNLYDKAKFKMLYTFTTQKQEPPDKIIEDISSKFFPNDYLSTWSVKTQEQKNNESWKKYITSLKRKSILRNRLKSNN